MNFRINRGVTTMELIEVITSAENLNRAYKKVVANKGASGVDGITVEELGAYIPSEQKPICQCQYAEFIYRKAMERKDH